MHKLINVNTKYISSDTSFSCVFYIVVIFTLTFSVYQKKLLRKFEQNAKNAIFNKH